MSVSIKLWVESEKKIKFKISVSNHFLMAKIEENWQKN